MEFSRRIIAVLSETSGSLLVNPYSQRGALRVSTNYPATEVLKAKVQHNIFGRPQDLIFTIHIVDIITGCQVL